MADLLTISNLATGGGTLVLAIATFGSVRSANRAVRVAEQALLQNMRPVLLPTRVDDQPEKIMWSDQHWARLPGARASVELVEGNIYLAFSMRNVGSGLGVLQSWQVHAPYRDFTISMGNVRDYRQLSRDLYIAPGDVGFWQTGLRDPEDPVYQQVHHTIKAREPFSVDLLYTDHEGGQRTVTRFGVYPHEGPNGSDEGIWLLSVARHWNLDHTSPH
jgi:hypothetical protein